MPKKVVEYNIYKAEQGLPWPGDFWDGPFKTLKQARHIMSHELDDEYLNFQIIVSTYEAADTYEDRRKRHKDTEKP